MSGKCGEKIVHKILQLTPSELVPCAHSCGLGRWSYKKVRRGGDCKHHQNYMNWWRSGFPKEQQLGSPKQHMADTLTISISLIDPDFFWSHDINICQAKMSINYSEIQTLSSIFYFLCYMFCEEKKKKLNLEFIIKTSEENVSQNYLNGSWLAK